MSAIDQFLVGIGLLCISASYRLPPVDRIDLQACLSVQSVLTVRPWISFFKLLWYFGRTEAVLIAIIGLTPFSPRQGISAALAFLAWGGIDRLLKVAFKRVRPFERQPGTQMLQARRPSDPSFPSGDAFHAWFLALIAIQAFQLPLLVSIVVVLLAVLISLGRVVLGVHYPFDVLAGTGIGIAAASSGMLLNDAITLIPGFRF